VIAGEFVAAEMIAAVQADVAVAGEQRGVGKRRGRVDGVVAAVAGTGNDRVELQDALVAADAVDAAVDGDAGVAQGPGYRFANVQAGGVLPADPVKDPASSVQRQHPGGVQRSHAGGFQGHVFRGVQRGQTKHAMRSFTKAKDRPATRPSVADRPRGPSIAQFRDRSHAQRYGSCLPVAHLH